MIRYSFLRLGAVSLLICCTLVGYADSPQVLPQDEQAGSLRFLESVPEETALDLEGLAEAFQVWPEIMDQAQESISVASFYFSRQGDGKDATAPWGLVDGLVPVLESLPRAGQRGCQVRVLGDGKFFDTYPEAITWLDQQTGIASRNIDARAHWGGVMHAKYFVVDNKTMYLGSQNWDWRAMTQIHELGALVEHPRLANQLGRIFDLDWGLADQEPSADDQKIDNPQRQPLLHNWDLYNPAQLVTDSGDTVQAWLAASPPQALPDDVPWDLPMILSAIEGASERIRIQLLSYGVTDRENRFWGTLDNALRQAAARKVQVQVILSNWAKARYSLPWIQSLAAIPGIEIKFSDIPEHSQGFIPFARVEHAKYMTVDGTSGWIGTSNWSRDYFFSSRNISLLMRGSGAIEQLDTFFETSWNGPYSKTIDPCGEYKPPRRY